MCVDVQTEGGRGDLWLAGVTLRGGERSSRGWGGGISTPCPISTLQFICVCVIDPLNPAATAIDPRDQWLLCACLCVCVSIYMCAWGGAEGREAIRLPWRQFGPWTLPLPLNIYRVLANQSQADPGHQPRHEGVCPACVFVCVSLCVRLLWLHTISHSNWTHCVVAEQPKEFWHSLNFHN